jgi:hypothetical protein
MILRLSLVVLLAISLQAQNYPMSYVDYSASNQMFDPSDKTVIGLSNIDNNGQPAVVINGKTAQVTPGKGAIIVQGMGSNIIGGASVFGSGGPGVAYYDYSSSGTVLSRGNVVYQQGQGTINGAPGGAGNGDGVYKSNPQNTAQIQALRRQYNLQFGAAPPPPRAWPQP